jgi:hypothetical protein
MKATRTMKTSIKAIVPCLIMTLCACSDPPFESNTAPSIEALFTKIVGGRITDERPAVGSINMDGAGCTATLVAPDVVVTAAHCVNYGTRMNSGQYGSFTIETRAERRSFSVTRYVSFGEQLGSDDVAILQLGDVVPADLASPAPVADRTPPAGSTLTVYGYGCTHRAANSDWQKRKASFQQGQQSSYLCPGDSGGPVIDENSGAVVRINSGYYLDATGTDIYGDIPVNWARVNEAIQQFSASGPVGPGGPPGGGEVRDDPTVGLSTVCGFHVQAKREWACNPDSVSRSRCRKGHAPESENCNAGCETVAGGQAARCSVQVSQPRCGDEYAAFRSWTCTADQHHMLRCNQGLVEVHRCARTCQPGQPMDREICLGG